MNIVNFSSPKTMSSSEIAELTGREKSNIHRDIRIMSVALGFAASLDDSKLNDLFSAELDERGYVKNYFLNKREVLILVSGYSFGMRANIIDRWHELESQQVPALPQTMAQALRLAADQAEQIEQQQAALQLAAPKVAALDLLSAADGETNLTLAAKELQMKPKAFMAFLSTSRWIYKRAGGGTWIAYQDRIESGFLVHKTTVIKMDDGSDKACDQVLVTAKGLAKLATLLASKGVK